MAIKISELALKSSPAGTEELEVNDAGTTKKVTAQAIASLAPAPSIPIASAITYSHATSGLAATNVQTALDEIDADVDALQAASAPAASAITYNHATSGLAATNVQTALDEIDADVDALQAASAPAASAISFNNAASGLAATNVQAALNEIDADVDALQAASVAASAVSYSNATSGLSATNVQTAIDQTDARVDTLAAAAAPPKVVQIACSDETTALTAGVGKATFRMPYAMTVSAVRASLTTAQTSGSIFTVDINEAGTSIISTKLTIDNTEKTSVTAATAAVISDASLADDAEITIDIDQIGDGTAKGLKVTLIGI